MEVVFSLYRPRISPKDIRLATTVSLLSKSKKTDNTFYGLSTLSQMCNFFVCVKGHV